MPRNGPIQTLPEHHINLKLHIHGGSEMNKTAQMPGEAVIGPNDYHRTLEDYEAAQDHSPFLALPPELRNEIYEYVTISDALLYPQHHGRLSTTSTLTGASRKRKATSTKACCTLLRRGSQHLSANLTSNMSFSS